MNDELRSKINNLATTVGFTAYRDATKGTAPLTEDGQPDVDEYMRYEATRAFWRNLSPEDAREGIAIVVHSWWANTVQGLAARRGK